MDAEVARLYNMAKLRPRTQFCESKMSTAETLSQLPDDGNRYELVQGEIRMMSPAGGRHGRIAGRVYKLLVIHVDDNKLGATFAAETGFRIAVEPDTVRAPDAAFVRQDKMDELDNDIGFLPFAPELAVEVVSPSDSFSAVEEKAFNWINAGTKIVLVVVPDSQSVHLYRSRDGISVHRSEDIINAEDAVPGWKFRVSEIFT